jgi:F-type H+-transporting ATPase subunit alpha
MQERQASSKREVGFVISTQDYLVHIEGLPSAKMNDIVVTKSGSRALVSALNGDLVEALMLDAERPKPGDFLELSDLGLSLPFKANLFGRTINPLGIPLDGKAKLPPGGERIDLDTVAPGIDGRTAITEQFYAGITVVDTLLPIGKGQRELILAEPRSGKRAFFLDVIVSQKERERICIYTAIGRAEVEVKRFAENVESAGAASYTVIVAATSDEAAPMITIAPAVSMSLAEYYRNLGKHVLLIFDDLASHAKYAREIALLAGRVPGRESYPADIFYQHSSLVERAGNFNDHYKNGSITLLPVIETNIENFTNLIPTNVMSQTDGHLLFSALRRAQGQYPAIEVDRSVTRVGRQTQIFIHKILSDRIRSLLAEFHELERYARFGSELSGETQLKIKRGKITEELLKQDPLTSIRHPVQILLLTLVFTGFFDKKNVDEVKSTKGKLVSVLSGTAPYNEMADNIESFALDDLVTKLTEHNQELEEKCRQ